MQEWERERGFYFKEFDFLLLFFNILAKKER
jgi:hypothetical protein